MAGFRLKSIAIGTSGFKDCRSIFIRIVHGSFLFCRDFQVRGVGYYIFREKSTENREFFHTGNGRREK
jgi:hypothetical protein